MFWRSLKEEGIYGCHDWRIPIYLTEWCLGSSAKTKGKLNGLFKIDFKTKHSTDDSIEKFIARFVALGFCQKEGIDYEETFAPVARYTSIRTILALASKMKWKSHQMDVKIAFLNGVIEEEVYII